MNGFDRLREQIKEQKDTALIEVVNYLLSREDMEQKYLNEEKNIEDMCTFIKNKAREHMETGWNYIEDKVVFSWAVMYYSLPNSFLKINTNKVMSKESKKQKVVSKNNVVSLEKAKEDIEKRKEIKQLTLFGGVA